MHHFISFLLRIVYAAGFGYVLIWHPDDIVRYIPQLLGGLLMLECVAQLLELFFLKTKTEVSTAYFYLPTTILIYGLILIFFCKFDTNEQTTIKELFNPEGGFSVLKMEMVIGGWCCLAFIISEIIISIAFFKPLYQSEKFAEEKRQRKEAEKALEAQKSREQEQQGKATNPDAASPTI